MGQSSTPAAWPFAIATPTVWSGATRRRVLRFADAAILAFGFLAAYELRFEFAVPSAVRRDAWIQLPVMVGCHLLALEISGIYRLISRYFGLADACRVGCAALYTLTLMLALRIAPGIPASLRIPISVASMSALIGIVGVLAARGAWRLWYERRELIEQRLMTTTAASGRSARVLLVGAGQAGLMAARELSRQPNSHLSIMGFVDDDPSKQGSVLHGIPVLGTTNELQSLAQLHGIEQLVITIARIKSSDLRRVIGLGERAGLQVRIMPSLFEILDGRVSVSRFCELRIEDLLGRDPVILSSPELQPFVRARQIMVTGAGGSIGSELARQVARLEPARLILVDRSEAALWAIHHELSNGRDDGCLVPIVADIADEKTMRRLLAAHQPHVVLHAAAHKHVPLMESNVCEAVRNNTLATHDLAHWAGEAGVGCFVLISSDKAVRPTSVMGATKRLAELFTQDLNDKFATRFVAVRFGNVVGSTGSVIPIFRRQIERGGPVTVTHADMVRYFMTIPEAAQLVLLAGAIGDGGEIFVLDMGTPVRIVDLAHEMIRLAGLEVGRDIELLFTGPRPGERLREQLELEDEALEKTAHPQIHVGRVHRLSPAAITEALAKLRETVVDGRDEGAVRALLAGLLPEAQLVSADSPQACVGRADWSAGRDAAGIRAGT